MWGEPSRGACQATNLGGTRPHQSLPYGRVLVLHQDVLHIIYLKQFNEGALH